jgi:ArsR family transcriptional regulator, arsenate/arsenite/antimonite-responsive transcriptional repressor
VLRGGTADRASLSGWVPLNKTTSGAPSTLADSAQIMKAMADPIRLRLLRLLADGELCVCTLCDVLELPQSTVSRHLAHLKLAGFVSGRRDGLWVHYRLAENISELHRRLLVSVESFLDDLLPIANDRARLEAHQRYCNSEG